MTRQRADVAVVGGGIVGLACALAACRQGKTVVLFERDEHAVGASIRNFGLITPVGHPAKLYERALRSREIWLDLATQADFWYRSGGSLHGAYHDDEAAVLEEFLETTPRAREEGCRMMTPREVADVSPSTKQDGLVAAMWSPTELNIDSREAIPEVGGVLERKYGVQLMFGTSVRSIDLPVVETTRGTWNVDRVFVCSGNDFQSLYPEILDAGGLQRCKLQMLRTVPQPTDWNLGPALCSSLRLLRYGSFKHCESLKTLQERLEAETPFLIEHGIKVLASQTRHRELVIGDSHHYGLTHDPFEREDVSASIVHAFLSMAQIPRPEVGSRWHGIYPLAVDGSSEVIAHPAPGVTIVNGLGGAGMTLAPGLAEEIVE